MKGANIEPHSRRLPHAVLAAIEAEIGGVESVTHLGGLSGRTVVAAHGPHGALVAKGPVVGAEISVATTLRADFDAHGIRIVDATLVAGDDQHQWLLFAYLPHALPRERWGADPGVIEVLRTLHVFPTETIAQITDRYIPSWDDALTAAALENLHASAPLTHSLRALARRCQYLFEPLTVVSADPNPLNWRVDTTGAPILIDWERITVAHPAIDLGILMPGLGDSATARDIARLYGCKEIEEIDLLHAKAWSLVELAATSPPESDATALISQVREELIDRLTSLAK